MKKTLTILKVIGLLVLLAAATLGYVFFRVWQNNERPRTSDVRWTENEILLGHTAQLEVEMEIPWHRELLSDTVSGPRFLAPSVKGSSFERGSIGLNGFRTWTASISLVATDFKSTDGLTLSLPLKRSKRPSPGTVNIHLPKLTISAPGNLPQLVDNPRDFLTQAELPAKTKVDVIPNNGTSWILIIVVLLALATVIIVYLRNQSGSIGLSAHEKALRDLQKLDEERDLKPDIFFSRLTDILKSYTSDRFGLAASAKTSSEFLISVYSLPELPQVETMELPWLARLADDVKFAGRDPKNKDPDEALKLVKNFVTKTKPLPETH